MRITNFCWLAEKSKKRLMLILIILILILFSVATVYWYKYCRTGTCQFSELQSPTVNLEEIKFYKGVSFLSASENELQEAKNLGANIVEFGISVQQNEEGKWVFSGSSNPQVWEEWPNKLSQEIKTANKLGMQAAVSLLFPTSGVTKDPEQWLEQAKPLYEELGKFSSQNNIYTIFIPGEVEIATGATCCSGKSGLEITANNEASQEGFIYWSSKISQEIKDQLRKNYSSRIVADYITGNWWFENERLVGPDPWPMADFYAIRSGVQLDDPIFDTNPGQTSEHRAKTVREVAKKSAVDKIIFSGPLANNLDRIQGREFTFSEDQRRSLYEIFFQKTSPSVNGYFLRRFPPNLADPIAETVAKEWWEKID